MARKRATAETQGVSTDDLSALKERITTKSADYTRTSTAYKSRCVDGMAVKLISQAKVLDMVAGWVQELINANTAQAVAQVTEPAQETDGQSVAGSELQDQDEGSVDLSDLRTYYPAS